MAKSADAFRTISEVADDLEIPKHVLRFWEAKFVQIRPMKRGGGRRYYRPEDMELLRGIRRLLHREGYTIKGVQKILREQGVDAVKHQGRAEPETGAALHGLGAGKGGQDLVPTKPKLSPRVDAPATARPQQTGPAIAENAAPMSAGSAAKGAKLLDTAARERIAAAIQELEACRILLGAPPPAAGTRSAPAAGTTRRSSSRS